MAAFEIVCLCGGHLEPLVQRGVVLPARTLGRPGVLFTCPDCSHVCAIPMPGVRDHERLVNMLYNPPDGGGTTYDLATAKLWYDGAPRLHVVDLVVDTIAQHFGTARGIRLHDFGAGPGDLVHHLRRAGVDATGSDPSPDALRIAREMGNAYTLSTDDLSEDTPYQAILLHHVLEHVVQPVELLSRCFRLMQPGGLIVILIPNGEFLPARTLGFGSWGWGNVLGHLHFYSNRSIAIALSLAGFNTTHVRGTSVGIRGYEAQDPAALVEEDPLQALWLMEALQTDEPLTYGLLCQRLPELARQGLTTELLATGVA